MFYLCSLLEFLELNSRDIVKTFPRIAAPAYRAYILVPPSTLNSTDASTHAHSDKIIMFRGRRNPATTAEINRPHMKPPL